MADQNERDRLLQTEWRTQILPNIGNHQWIRVYQREDLASPSSVNLGSVIVPNSQLSTVMESCDWDDYVDNAGPSYSYATDHASGERRFLYSQFGNDLGIMPIVIWRTYNCLKPPTLEILEDFRLFHNLYFDIKRNKYLRLDDNGDDIEVVRVTDNAVDVKRKDLRQYLAVKNSSLAIHVELRCFSPLTIDALEEQDREYELRESDLVLDFHAYSWDEPLKEWRNSFSRLLAKKLMRGFPPENIDMWPFDQSAGRKYASFIIDVDKNDDPVYFTSDPDKLADFFGKNEDAPNYLTRVFFRREVLKKYYSESTKYKVEDGALWCGDLWLLRMDNNHADFIIVYLGDLGRDLPYKEHSHWKHYNVPPEGGLSRTAFKRDFLAEFTDAKESALRFQKAYDSLSASWRSTHGWHLFKPLSDADSHHFRILRRPLSSEPTEFHGIVLSLSILLQDRIAKKEIGKAIPGFQPKDDSGRRKGSISVLGEYLESEGFPDTDQYVEYLRMLQLLRSNSGAVHPRNEKEYRKAEQFFGLETKPTTQVADDFFTTLTDFLDSLRERFCPDDAT